MEIHFGILIPFQSGLEIGENKMPDIVFMDSDGNEVVKDLKDIESFDDFKNAFKELQNKKKKKGKK